MIEIEKKYKLTKERFDRIKFFLKELPTVSYSESEENILYSGNSLSNSEVLRVRIVKDDGAIVTYKGRATVEDDVKSRVELESSVSPTFISILKALGYKKDLVYEKNRTTYCSNTMFPSCLICLDELPFGYYMEIEGTKEAIERAETYFLEKLDVEAMSYPELTRIYGKSVDGVMEARFLGV